MRGTVAKDFRRQAGKVASQTAQTLSGPINAALTNEAITRGRVQELEANLVALGSRVGDQARLLSRPFLGRLRWLFLGR